MPKQISVARLRMGVFFFALFWLPAYLLVPAITVALGVGDSAEARQKVLITILLVQSAFGIIGFLLIGKTVAVLLKKSKPKKLPKLVWHIFWSGQLPPQAE